MENLEALREKEEELEVLDADQVKALSEDLLEQMEKKDEDNMTKIIKKLAKVKMTVKLIKHTLVGKTLTRIITKDKTYFQDPAIQEKSQNLINIWKQAGKNEMAQRKKEQEKQQKREEEEEDKEEEETPERKEQLDAIPKDIKLPHITKQIAAKMDKVLNEGAQRCCRMFTELLQKHPDHKQGVFHTLRIIEKAPKVAFQIAKEMQENFKDDPKGFSAQMVTLAQGIGLTNASLRVKLLSGEVTPEAFAKFQKQDLLNQK